MQLEKLHIVLMQSLYVMLIVCLCIMVCPAQGGMIAQYTFEPDTISGAGAGMVIADQALDDGVANDGTIARSGPSVVIDAERGNVLSVADNFSGGMFVEIDSTSQSYTFATWYKGVDQPGYFFDQQSVRFVIELGQAKVYNGDWTSDLSSSAQSWYLDNTWHHIAIVLDGTVDTWSLYVDGVAMDLVPGRAGDQTSVPLANAAGIPDLSSSQAQTFFTRYSDDMGVMWGLYDDVRLYDRVLDAQAIVEIMQGADGDSCYNEPPTVTGPEALQGYAELPMQIDVTVEDDGKPYVEGCDPEDPNSGTAYGLQYEWSQASGPAPVQFAPISADTEDIAATFTRAGTYEVRLRISDGPAEADGKTTEYRVVVMVLDPPAGDVNRNGCVDIDDLSLMAAQWLDDCLDSVICADLDDSGTVSGADYSILASNWLANTETVVISEFVASNRSSLMDGDGNTPDWIELHNRGTEPVSLAGWYLTDDRDNPNKWPFPSQAVLPAGGYWVVFASGQPVPDYMDAGGHYHTNFALSKDGEYLALINPDGTVAHEFSPAFPPQENDISYGMWFTEFRYFEEPTPGQPNSEAFTAFTDKPSHGRSHGFYDQPFDVYISCKTPDAFIHYTLDGSEPTEQHGLMYDPNMPIHIAATTTLRSAAFKPGWRSGGTDTDTYIFVDDVAVQPANPVGWPSDWGQISVSTVPADYEMDPRVVNNDEPDYTVQEALLDIPTVSISMEPDDFISVATGIYANPLSRWERKCSVEYMHPNGTGGFQEDCKIEIHGNSSRNPYRMQKHSIRLTFTSLYGASKLKHPLFPESAVDEFNQLVLRACFTDSWGLVSWSGYDRYRPNDSQYIRDIWMKESLRAMGQPSSHGNYTHLYVNGLYWGIYNLTERLSEDFFADHLGGEPEDWEINADFRSEGLRWKLMETIDPSTSAGYAAIQDYLDIENFIDYMLLHFYADAEDWPSHNGYAAANAISGDGKFRFFVWDQEIVLDYHGRAALRIDSTGSPGDIFQKLRLNEEFRLLFSDRVQTHCFHDGALSLTASQERYQAIADWIDKAIVAESARWGDTQMSTPYGGTILQPDPLDDINHNAYPPAPNGPDYYFTREDSWVIERDNVINHYIPAIHDTANTYAFINLFRSENLYPSMDAPVLNINGAAQHGGYVSAGDIFTITNPGGAGVVYVTLDGSDPRLPGGAIHPAAQIFETGAMTTQETLTCSTRVKARILYGGEWSALSETVYAVGPVRENLRMTELMYHPQDVPLGDPNAEFIELQNIGAETINLSQVRFDRGVDFTFPDLSLPAGEFVVVVKNQVAFASQYPEFSGIVAGEFAGSLDNDGERIRLTDAVGTIIHDFKFKDGWFTITDGEGFTLNVRDAATAAPDLWGEKSVWAASTYRLGTPGAVNSGPLPGDVVVNEILAHSDLQPTDWIELYNTTGSEISLGGWFLSDNDADDANLMKYRIAEGTILHPGGFLVLTQNEHFANPDDPGCLIPFALSENGEMVCLSSGTGTELTGYREKEEFGASLRDVSMGRYQKSTGTFNFVMLESRSPDSANSDPKVGPVVISEIMYHPQANSDAEYVELVNISGQAVTLYDNDEKAGWRLSDENGIEFVFPTPATGGAITLAPSERLLLVKDVASFETEFVAPIGIQILPWGDGSLSNSGEKIQLSQPGEPDGLGGRYWIRVDRVVYSDGSHPDHGTDPWPAASDGSGSALKRINDVLYGNDVSNWQAGNPSPGS